MQEGVDEVVARLGLEGQDLFIAAIAADQWFTHCYQWQRWKEAVSSTIKTDRYDIQTGASPAAYIRAYQDPELQGINVLGFLFFLHPGGERVHMPKRCARIDYNLEEVKAKVRAQELVVMEPQRMLAGAHSTPNRPIGVAYNALSRLTNASGMGPFLYRDARVKKLKAGTVLAQDFPFGDMQCAHCGKPACVLVCSHCCAYCFCSRECQRAARATHRPMCERFHEYMVAVRGYASWRRAKEKPLVGGEEDEAHSGEEEEEEGHTQL